MRSDGQRPGGSRLPVAALALGLVLVAAAALAPMVGGRPANTIPVERADRGDDLSSPTGAIWDEVPQVTVPLTAAPSSVPNASKTTVKRVYVQAARTDERLYVRLRWPDATADRNASDPRRFTDGAAVQIPVNASGRPPLAMGGRGNLVNVWYWRPGGAQELLAGGAGTTTQFPNASVRATATRHNGSWIVVYRRPLASDVPNRTAIAGDRNRDVAVAVWNGSNAERAGRKSVSEWYTLAMGPGPQGPPYETVLWTVAGLAIVGVILVTIQGVRRA